MAIFNFHQSRPNWVRVSLLVVSCLFVTACNNDKPDLQAYVDRVKAQQKEDIPPVPVMEPYKTFVYAAAELREPFTPTVIEIPEEDEPVIDNGIKPNEHRQKEVLEEFELSSLSLMGTLEQDSLWALIRSPDGVIHRVKQGNYIGKNHGKIIAIMDSSLTILEIVKEIKGGYVERESMLSVAEVN
jgi:type IV pilus assembly protein PilP